MKKERWLWMIGGLLIGGVVATISVRSPKYAYAGNDRFEDYIMCTGPVTVLPNYQTDGIWLLDYRGGRLLGTVIDRVQGKILTWAEVDLVQEFGIQPKEKNTHFMMTTGSITLGQAALYVAETSTGRVGVYTMGPRNDKQPGLAIRRHDMTTFRPKAGG